MKSNHPFCLFLFTTLACVMVVKVASEQDDLPPPDVRAVAGIWIGIDEDNLKFYRLELEPGGKGYCSSCFVDNPAKLYSIGRWSMERFAIKIDLVPIDKEAESIFMRGEASTSTMALQVGGTLIQWKKKLTMVKEADLEEKNAKARKRIERYRKGGA